MQRTVRARWIEELSGDMDHPSELLNSNFRAAMGCGVCISCLCPQYTLEEGKSITESSVVDSYMPALQLKSRR